MSDKPPAADVVSKSGATENEASEIIALKRKLEEREKTIKEREIRVSELEDENRRLKTPPAPTPTPKGKSKSEVLNEWLW